MKSIIKTHLLAPILFLLVVSYSCKYDEILPPQVELPEDTISYELDIQPFFDAKCVSCHAGTVPPNLEASVSYEILIEDNWVDTAAPAESPLYLSIEIGGSMETYANATERALVLKWIEQGANNN